MNVHNPDLHVLLGDLECSAFSEFNDVLDYIYKSPRLLTHEKDLERLKLAVYFPQGGKQAEIRNHYESVKLNEIFPRLIAMGNLFMVASIFEKDVFNLLRILQEQSPAVPKPEMSRGVADHLKAMKAYGAAPCDAQYYEQILVAIGIRNCLMHAGGLLAASSQANVLKTWVSHRKFFSPDMRKKEAERQMSSDRNEVTIEGAGLSEQLVITNDYAYLASVYFRDYFCALCGTLNPNTALRPAVLYMDPRDLFSDRARQGPIM